MTSPSEFVDGERIWNVFVFWSTTDRGPVVRIRRGIFRRSPMGWRWPMIALDDGRVEVIPSFPESCSRVFRTRVEAVASAIEQIGTMRNRCDAAMEELREMDEPGDPAAASISAAGVAPPEVAT